MTLGQVHREGMNFRISWHPSPQGFVKEENKKRVAAG
jgi:hypothetical protein